MWSDIKLYLLGSVDYDTLILVLFCDSIKTDILVSCCGKCVNSGTPPYPWGEGGCVMTLRIMAVRETTPPPGIGCKISLILI